MTMINAAREYLLRGFVPIPVEHGTKKPAIAAWTEFKPTADDLKRRAPL